MVMVGQNRMCRARFPPTAGLETHNERGILKEKKDIEMAFSCPSISLRPKNLIFDLVVCNLESPFVYSPPTNVPTGRVPRLTIGLAFFFLVTSLLQRLRDLGLFVPIALHSEEFIELLIKFRIIVRFGKNKEMVLINKQTLGNLMVLINKQSWNSEIRRKESNARSYQT